ncbi:MAG: 50S ribosomal protein L18 [Tissierellia bacterium]|nr:50S ribosomal protein L18 [Tissierellia bacterium]
MLKPVDKQKNRRARHARVRKKLSGTPDRPRLTIYKSNTNIYAQLVDDTTGTTLVQASTLDKELRSEEKANANKETAKKVGELIGKRAQDKGITDVVFDRSGYRYHGKVKELADGAREAGLKF